MATELEAEAMTLRTVCANCVCGMHAGGSMCMCVHVGVDRYVAECIQVYM